MLRMRYRFFGRLIEFVTIDRKGLQYFKINTAYGHCIVHVQRRGELEEVRDLINIMRIRFQVQRVQLTFQNSLAIFRNRTFFFSQVILDS
ncbi:hypothetical protein D9M69_660670 [compost metagenome]